MPGSERVRRRLRGRSRAAAACSLAQKAASSQCVPSYTVVQRLHDFVGAAMQAPCKVEVLQPVPMAAAHAVGKSMRPWAGGAEAEDVLLQAQRRHLMHAADDGVHCRCVRASSLLTGSCTARMPHSVAWWSTMRVASAFAAGSGAHLLQPARARASAGAGTSTSASGGVWRRRAGPRPPGRLPTSLTCPRNPRRRPPP